MNIYLCLLGPSLLSIRIFCRINKIQTLNKNILFYYGFFIFINNFISSLASIVIFGIRDSMDASLINQPVFAIKYLTISIIISTIIPFMIEFINKNINYDIEVIKNEKRNNKKKIKETN